MKITLIPDVYSQQENPGMYCNYARKKSRMKKDVLFAIITANMQENIQYS